MNDLEKNTSAEEPVRQVPVEDLETWAREYADLNDKDGQQLEGVLERNPNLVNDPRITSALSRIATRKEVLRDFQGMLIGTEEAAAGRLDDLSELDDLTDTEQ